MPAKLTTGYAPPIKRLADPFSEALVVMMNDEGSAGSVAPQPVAKR